MIEIISFDSFFVTSPLLRVNFYDTALLCSCSLIDGKFATAMAPGTVLELWDETCLLNSYCYIDFPDL